MLCMIIHYRGHFFQERKYLYFWHLWYILLLIIQYFCLVFWRKDLLVMEYFLDCCILFFLQTNNWSDPILEKWKYMHNKVNNYTDIFHIFLWTKMLLTAWTHLWINLKTSFWLQCLRRRRTNTESNNSFWRKHQRFYIPQLPLSALQSLLGTNSTL